MLSVYPCPGSKYEGYTPSAAARVPWRLSGMRPACFFIVWKPWPIFLLRWIPVEK